MDSSINPDSLLVAAASLAHPGHPDVAPLIGLAHSLATQIFLYQSIHIFVGSHLCGDHVKCLLQIVKVTAKGNHIIPALIVHCVLWAFSVIVKSLGTFG